MAPSWIVLGAVIVGGLFGLFQVPAWQGCAMIGAVIGQVLLTYFQSSVIAWANRLYLLGRFALQGGLGSDDPGAVLGSMGELPPLLATNRHQSYFMLGLFLFLLVATYLLGRWCFRLQPSAFGPFLIYRVSLSRRLVACGLGAINGYLIVRSLTPLLFPEPETLIKVSGGQLSSLLDERLVMVLIGFVLVLIVFGLQTSGRGRG